MGRTRGSRRVARPSRSFATLVLLSALGLLGAHLGCTSAPPPAPEQEAADTANAGMTVEREDRTAERIVSLPSEPPPWQSDFEAPFTFFPYLADEEEGSSVAVGRTNTGWMANGRPLPSPPRNVQMLPVQYARGLRYGTEEIIDTIVAAGDTVAEEFPGSVLFTGNIGDRHGGDIPWSVSHNNGRDADLAYYSENPFGWQSRPNDLLHFDRDLLSREHYGFYRFDPDRNAVLIETLFKHASTQVQYMFIARHLQRAVLPIMRRREVLSAEQLDQLGQVMYEPRSALPHDDHLHLRIYCSRDDVCGGCVNDGIARPWVDRFEDDRAVCIEELVTKVRSDERARERAYAMLRLGLLDATDRVDVMVDALGDESAEVRRAAVEVLGDIGGREIVKAIIALDEREDAVAVRCAVATALSKSELDTAAEHIATMLEPEDAACVHRDGEEEPFSAVVARAAAETETKAPVASLIELLADPRPVAREAAADALRRLTNHAVAVAVDVREADRTAREAARAAWRQWYEANADKSRDAWLVDGFKASGYPVSKLGVESIEPLLDAIQGPSHVSYNAQRVLMRISRTKPNSLQWSAYDAAWHWTRYFKKNSRRYGIDLSHRSERPDPVASAQ